MYLEHVEMETLRWVSWFNRERLMGRLDYLSKAEYEEQDHGRKARAVGD